MFFSRLYEKNNLETFSSINKQLEEKVKSHTAREEWKNAEFFANRLKINAHKVNEPMGIKKANDIYVNVKAEKNPYYSKAVGYGYLVVIGFVLGAMFLFNGINANVVGDFEQINLSITGVLLICMGIIALFIVFRKKHLSR